MELEVSQKESSKKWSPESLKWKLQASQKKSIRKMEMGGSQKKINNERQFETLEIPRKKMNKELELGVPQSEKTNRKWILEAPKQQINKIIQLWLSKKETKRKLEPGAPRKKIIKNVELEVSKKENQYQKWSAESPKR